MTRLCLIAPPAASDRLADRADGVCALADVAAIRIAAAGADESALRRAAAALEPIRRARDVALLLETHFELARALDLDGAHIDAASGRQRAAAEALGADAILGVGCGASRHAGMIAAEHGAAYVSFGPVADAGLLDEGDVAPPELFEWWQEMIEVPVCAEGGVDAAAAARLKGAADFLYIGPEIWLDGPEGDLAAIAAAA